MNTRLVLCIAMGVFVVHLGVFMILTHLNPPPKTPLPPPPNFKVRSQTVVDRETGETTTYREITVSTQMAVPSLPPPEVTPAPETAAVH